MFENFLVIYFKYNNLPKGDESCAHTPAHTHTHGQLHTLWLLILCEGCHKEETNGKTR